jgi:hypothetical protein
MSALFWWSAVSTSMGLAQHLAAEVCDGHLDGLSPPGPSMSAYRLDMSVMRPILTGPVDLAGAGGSSNRPTARAATMF